MSLGGLVLLSWGGRAKSLGCDVLAQLKGSFCSYAQISPQLLPWAETACSLEQW